MKVAALLLSLTCACGSSGSNTSPAASAGSAGISGDNTPGGATSAGSGGREESGGTGGAAGHGNSTTAGDGGAAGEAGIAGTSACDPASISLDAVPHVHGLSLERVAFFQSVKVPLMEQLFEVTDRRVQVVSNRPGLLRVYVNPSPSWLARLVRARLTLASDGDVEMPQVFDQTLLVLGESSDGALVSTFNFDISAELVSESSAYSVELFETDPCAAIAEPVAGARFPATGLQSLGVYPASKLKVELVPIAFDVGQSSLLPDSSAPQLEQFRARVMSLFPITGIDLSVRAEPLHTSSKDLLAALEQITQLRANENSDPDLTYFGLFRFTDSIDQYCNPSCVLGASVTGTTPTGGVAVGIGYASDQAATTFAHELGHVYGRPHSPCGVAGDPSYPYSGGRVGSWGYDVAKKMLIDPNTYTDFMGYCSPNWVSDFTFEHLREFIAAMDQPAAAASSRPSERPANLIRSQLMLSKSQ